MSSLSNLERFLLRVTPDVPSLTLQSCCSDLNAQWLPPGKDTIEYFTLKDLWDCYYEWSAFGAGIPMILENGDTLVQYYAPYLSATQIYISKSRIRKEYGEGVEVECDSLSEDSASDNLSRSPSNNSSKAWDDASLDSGSDQVGSCTTKDMLGALYLQYSENSPPYQRVPFSEKITELAKSHPGLMRLKSVDISPTSWMAVSWYPIYSVPCHKNKRDQTSFLTFHSLSSFQDCASKYDEIHTGNNKSCLIDWRNWFVLCSSPPAQCPFAQFATLISGFGTSREEGNSVTTKKTLNACPTKEIVLKRTRGNSIEKEGSHHLHMATQE
ncbi:hypothetical protein JHK82_057087 [Glycine max]|nr:hypothetical protein JHK85_057945 [Glycine max]KAG5075749.1 hypothetical protein JHK84_056980 [Glycine max]KAG5078392.1 hypothetical protein JHK82_057087 [Glycine max]